MNRNRYSALEMAALQIAIGLAAIIGYMIWAG